MRTSYLTYAMSVIVSRALPDVRDGLKPSQRRILVAMNDLSLGPNASRKKCAKIAGDTSGNYHPHGEQGVYPTLVRMAQDWVMREVLVDKQGNFGSLAGLPPAAMRYTEARLSPAASEMLRDPDRNTVDFVPTYDQEGSEPVVLPARFPNLLVNGSSGIAVGMATSIPPHNMAETAAAVRMMIDDPEVSVDELMTVLPAPDFPTGGIICGRWGLRQGYQTGRSTLTLRAKTHFEEERNSDVIVVTEIPYMETRDRIREKLELLVRDERIKGISRIVDLTDRNVPSWQVRLHIVLKRDADKEVVLNQLFKFSPLQSTISVILLALSGGRPKLLTIRDLILEFIRHRVDVIRRRTEFLLAEARRRKHTVEGLLIAQIDVDEVIRTIRNSPSRAEAKIRLQAILVPGGLVERALGADGFAEFIREQGTQENYSLSANQSEAIVSMQLGSLANLEREKLADEHRKLLADIGGYLLLLADELLIRAVVRDEMDELAAKFPNPRRTEISEDELTDVDRDELITEEMMAVTLSQRGYIKRTVLTEYKAQHRGGKGIIGARSDDEDPMQHLFVTSTHAYMLFFTTFGKVFWQKVYDLPLQPRTGKGRALINLLQVAEGEEVASCVSVRDFAAAEYLLMVTRKGVVKKTSLSAYSRPLKGGLIGISLDDGDSLIAVLQVGEGDDIVLATAAGMSIRFSHDDARAMGRKTRGVKGITLVGDDYVVGAVIAQPDRALLTVCERGYGKRTPFGMASFDDESEAPADSAGAEGALADSSATDAITTSTAEEPTDTAAADDSAGESEAVSGGGGNMRYRRQRRGGKGLRDIRTTSRNGKVIGILSVSDDDEVLMVTNGGKVQRIRAEDISQVGRNTQGVRIISLSEDDRLASLALIRSDEIAEELLQVPVPAVPRPLAAPPVAADEPDTDDEGEDSAD